MRYRRPTSSSARRSSAFMDAVVNGYKNPYYEWEKHFANALPRFALTA
jgi:hypothetical protein